MGICGSTKKIEEVKEPQSIKSQDNRVQTKNQQNLSNSQSSGKKESGQNTTPGIWQDTNERIQVCQNAKDKNSLNDLAARITNEINQIFEQDVNHDHSNEWIVNNFKIASEKFESLKQLEEKIKINKIENVIDSAREAIIKKFQQESAHLVMLTLEYKFDEAKEKDIALLKAAAIFDDQKIINNIKVEKNHEIIASSSNYLKLEKEKNMDEFQQKLLDDPGKMIDDVMSRLSKEERNTLSSQFRTTMAKKRTTLTTNLLEEEAEKLKMIQKEFVEKQQIVSEDENESYSEQGTEEESQTEGDNSKELSDVDDSELEPMYSPDPEVVNELKPIANNQVNT